MHVVNGLKEDGYEVSKAILVHRSAGGHAARGFATIHDVSSPARGRPELQAGTLLGTAQLEQVLVGLNKEHALRFIEPHILAHNSNALVWWRPPGKARIWFNTDAASKDGEVLVGTRSGVTPHPGLVFAATAHGWYVWAVKGSDRPTPQTVLHQAPYMNVSDNGAICIGNASVPKGFHPSVAPGYEEAWWGSRFTHSNIQIKRRLTRWKGGVHALWIWMLSARRRTFPERALVPLKFTVADVIAQAGGSHRRAA